MALTPRQKEVFDFLCRFIEAHRHAPTIAEIRAHFGLSSPASVHQLLSALEHEGMIRRVPHASRAIEIVKQTSFDSPSEVPLLGVVAAGAPIEAILSHEVISVPPDLAGRGRTFALRVKGDSMIDEHIAEGDFVIVESRNTANTGDMVVALVDGSDATVKRFYPETDGVRLQPANPNYEPIMIRPASRVTVQGVVVGVIRKYRH
ncbi:MAG TPA: transcriptional repressor LexA [Blastocatellia bacterium]|nr:transcriptional repressor LexA [Blastocatellia bacterium]